MATTVARLEVVLGADTSGFDRAIGKSEGRLKSIAKTGAFAAGAAGLGAIAYTLKTGIHEWMEQQKVAAQTEAVLKSTGGVANVTAKQVSNLATSLMKKSGTDDEAIASGENLLLTFKNIRNEVGKGNDIFTQATKATLDLSVAFHKDMHSSAILVGKALNDPIKGLTALQRVGVTFTAAQKDQIKALEDSGHHLQAQKIIMQELRSEVGGSAQAYGKTLPGMINIARESFNNWAGDLVTKMIPIITRLVNYIRDNWPVISAAIHNAWVGTIKPALTAMIDIVVAVVTTIRNNWGTIGPIVRQVADIIRLQVRVITETLQTVAALLRGDWSAAWDHLKNAVGAAIEGIKARIQLGFTIIKNLMSTLGGLALDGLRDGLAGLRDLAFHLVIDRFTGAIDSGVKAVKSAVTGLFGRVIGWVKDVLGIGSPSAVFHEIGQNVIRGFVNGIGSMAGVLKNAVVGMVKSLPSKALGVAGDILGGGGEIKSAPGEHSVGSAEKYLVPWAQQEGITVTSIAGGNHVKGSYHYQHRAIDVDGGYAKNRDFFADSINHFGAKNITELFFDPMGYYIKNGKRIKGAIGGHGDHVHIALDKGGWLPTGTNLITNNTGRPERVLGPGEGGMVVINYNGTIIHEREAEQRIVDLLARAQRRGPLGLSGGFA